MGTISRLCRGLLPHTPHGERDAFVERLGQAEADPAPGAYTRSP